MAKVLVIYHSFSGKSKTLAEAAAEGARSAGAAVVIKCAAEVTIDDVASANAVLIGTPQPFQVIAGDVKSLFERLFPVREKIVQGTPLGVFICYASDASGTLAFLEKVASRFGFRKSGEWLTIKGADIDAGIALCRQLGENLVRAI